MTLPRLSFWLKLLVSGLLLAHFFNQTDLSAVLGAVSSIPLSVFLAGVVLTVIAVALNGYKWSILLPGRPLGVFTRAVFVAQYYGLVLPGQILGEIGKTVYVSRRTNLDLSTIIATIAFDKGTGLLGGVFLLGAFGALMTTFPLPLIITAAFIAALIAGVGGLLLLRVDAFYRFLEQMLMRVPLLSRAGSALETFRALAKRSTALLAGVALGLLYQLISVVVVVLIATSMGISVSIVDWCWILPLLSLILLLPISVGGLGLREGTLLGLLGLFSVPPALSLSLSLSLFAIQVILAGIGAFIEFMPKRTV